MEVISIESERTTHTPGRLIYLNEVNGLSHWDHFTALAVSSNWENKDQSSASKIPRYSHVIFASHWHTFESWDPFLVRLAVRSFREFSRKHSPSLCRSVIVIDLTLTINNRQANWYGWRPISVRSLNHWKMYCVCCRYHSCERISRENRSSPTKRRDLYFEDIQSEDFITDLLTHLLEISIDARDIRLSIFIDGFLRCTRRDREREVDDQRGILQWERGFEQRTILRRIERVSSRRNREHSTVSESRLETFRRESSRDIRRCACDIDEDHRCSMHTVSTPKADRTCRRSLPDRSIDLLEFYNREWHWPSHSIPREEDNPNSFHRSMRLSSSMFRNDDRL